jgi:reductive dehalogenase
MEKLARVERPTTRIDAERIPRVPQRSNFFVRAAHGDLGPKPQREFPRFVKKYPLSDAMADVMDAMVPLQDGEVAEQRAPGTDDSEVMAEHIKALCYFLDIDIVGICEAPAYCWYSHRLDGTAIEPYHRYAIVMVLDQGFETMWGASGDDWISGTQSYRAYVRGAEIADIVAGYIRRLGYPARAQTNRDSDVLQIPLALLAGIGEIGRMGEVVINPFIGPRSKTVVVTTDLPMAVDKPIDFGLQDFCEKCNKCARECPCGAISHGPKTMFNGYEMWKPDVEMCAKYRVTNPGGAACGRCMKMCPFEKEGILHHRIALWMAIKWPWTRRLLIWLDDVLGYGERNPVKKWWLDLETVDGAVRAPRKVNARDIAPDKARPEEQAIALYPADTVPPPRCPDPYPTDRKAAITAVRPSGRR